MTSPVSAIEKPARIWAYGNNRGSRVWTPMKPVIAGAHEEQEYVRADLHEEAARKAEALQRDAFDIVADWHDKQAATFREMAGDIRSGELGRAKAAEAAKHHAASAAALRLHRTNRARALLGGENAE